MNNQPENPEKEVIVKLNPAEADILKIRTEIFIKGMLKTMNKIGCPEWLKESIDKSFIPFNKKMLEKIKAGLEEYRKKEKSHE